MCLVLLEPFYFPFVYLLRLLCSLVFVFILVPRFYQRLLSSISQAEGFLLCAATQEFEIILLVKVVEITKGYDGTC